MYVATNGFYKLLVLYHIGRPLFFGTTDRSIVFSVDDKFVLQWYALDIMGIQWSCFSLDVLALIVN